MTTPKGYAATPAPPTNTAKQASSDEEPKKKRERGRPRGRNDPSIDWEAIENAYVWGETISQREDGTYVRKYPTYRELGAKFEVAPTLVHYYSKKQNWPDRRLSCIAKTKQEYDLERSKAAALKTVNVAQIIDAWLEAFAVNIKSGKVRADSISDLDKIVRLKAFVEGKGDSSVTHHVHVTLEALQERHAAQRGKVLRAAGQVAGELAAGDGELGGEVIEAAAEPSAGAQEPRSASTRRKTARKQQESDEE